MALLFVGFALGAFINAQFWLPLIYSLPRSTYLFFKGKIKFMAIPSHILVSGMWFGVWVAVYLILDAFSPYLHSLLYHPMYVIGWNLSLVVLLLNFFKSKGRSDMRDDYDRFTYSKYRKSTVVD